MTTAQDRELEQWMAGSRSTEAARGRRRTTAWHQHGPADATLVGVLLDIAERGTEVHLILTTDRTHHGHVLTVAASWLIMRTTQGIVLLRLRCIAAIDCADPRVSFGERAPAILTDFTVLLERSIEIGDELRVRCGQRPLDGVLRALSREIAILETGPTNRRYVSIEAIDEVIIVDRSARS